jgi:hypothetical protein
MGATDRRMAMRYDAMDELAAELEAERRSLERVNDNETRPTILALSDVEGNDKPNTHTTQENTMSTFTLPPATDASGNPWPAGIYQVTLLNMEDDDRPSRFGDTPRVKVTFHVDKVIRLTPCKTPEETAKARATAKTALADSATLIAWCNKTMAKRATLRGWIEALLGREIANSEVVNPLEAVGKVAEALLETYTGDDGVDKVKLTTLSPVALEDDSAPF